MRYLLAIDQGTTGSTALLMDENLKPVAEASCDFEQHFPQPGWVEHDLNQIWESVKKATAQVITQIDPKLIAAIGITNQRETLCFWDKKSGDALARAIVWQDRRTAEHCSELKKTVGEKFFSERTGLLLDPYFSGTKASWALKNWARVKDAAKNGSLAAGTIDSFLISKICGPSVHVTEPSNASRTLCFNIHKNSWDQDLCQALEVPVEIWPKVLPSAGLFGKSKGFLNIPDGTPITGVLGDQQSALLGQTCFREGTAKCTYGTGAFLLLNTGSKPVTSHHRLLTTIAWSLKPNEITYALEGSAFIAGAAVQWLRDGLKIIKSAEEIEALAKTVSSSQGVVFVPALTGLGAPYWNPHATGMLTGLTRGSTTGHIARAVLEGIAFQNADLLNSMQKDLGIPLTSLNVDGGAAANNLLMQFQADLLGVKLRRPKFLETTSLGAIFAAGLGVGVWTELNQIEKTWKVDREFISEISEDERTQLLKHWHEAISRVNLPSQI